MTEQCPHPSGKDMTYGKKDNEDKEQSYPYATSEKCAYSITLPAWTSYR